MQLETSDELFNIRLWLLERLNIVARPLAWGNLDLSDAAVAARVLCLRQTEVQQLQGVDDLQQTINPRNEAAALALLAANQTVVCGSSPQRKQQLQELLAAYPDRPMLHDQQHNTAAAAAAEAAYGPDTPEQQLYSWVVSQGANVQVTPALFPAHVSSSSSSSSKCEGASETACATQQQEADSIRSSPAAATGSTGPLRGCSAAADSPAGSCVISLPSRLLMTYKTAAESDFGRVLTKIGLDPETLAVVWTMVERWDEEAAARPFWAALPQQFDTGLSVPEPLVDLLKGTPVHQEMVAARQHVRQQFKDLQQAFTVLLAGYPNHLQESWFSEQNYLWAVELWYAYAIQVKFPDGSIQPTLAPFVSLINHSPWPHIVHFSTVDPKTRNLNLTTFRPVQQHEQVFLSYGPLPNSQLLLFYGFVVEQNPFDDADLVIDLQQIEQQQQQGVTAAAAAAGDVAAQVRILHGLGLDLKYKLTVQQAVPPGLLACLRLLCCSADELQAVQEAMQQHKVTSSDERSAAVTASGGKSAGKQRASSQKSSSVRSSCKSSSSSSSGGNELQRRWAAAARWSQVLGQPLSPASEAAVQKTLEAMLSRAKAPFEACIAKIARRRQLQAVLMQKQQEQAGTDAGSSSSRNEGGFVACMEAYLKGIVALYDACARECGL